MNPRMARTTKDISNSSMRPGERFQILCKTVIIAHNLGLNYVRSMKLLLARTGRFGAWESTCGSFHVGRSRDIVPELTRKENVRRGGCSAGRFSTGSSCWQGWRSNAGEPDPNGGTTRWLDPTLLRSTTSHCGSITDSERWSRAVRRFGGVVLSIRTEGKKVA